MLRMLSRAFGAVYTKPLRFSRDESGSVLTMLVIVPVLVGVAALGIQTGQIYGVKRKMQIAADAAALGGSLDSLAGSSAGTIATDAKYQAQINGFTDGANGVTVTVNSPPLSGPNIGTPGAVQVIITQNQSFNLAAALNSWLGTTNSSSFTMQASAVAAQATVTSTPNNAVGCIVGLTTNNEQGVLFDNFNNFTSNCALVTNATATVPGHVSEDAIFLGGFTNATILTAWARGTITVNYYTGTFTTTYPVEQLQTGLIVDPYASLATPFAGTCTYTNYSKVGSGSGLTASVSPGTYCGGLSVTVYNTINFAPGTYYIADGLLNLSSDNVTCTGCTGGAGVTFVFTTVNGTPATIGGANISTNNIKLTAPSTGTYAGILFYQDRRATLATGGANSSPPVGKMFYLGRYYTTAMISDISGAIYFPSQMIELAAVQNTSSANCTVFIGWYVHFTMSEYHTNDGDYITGCKALGTIPVSIPITTTTTTARVLQ